MHDYEDHMPATLTYRQARKICRAHDLHISDYMQEHGLDVNAETVSTRSLMIWIGY